MDALLWVGNFFWLAFVGVGALIALLWIGHILRFAFFAGDTFFTANVFGAVEAPPHAP